MLVFALVDWTAAYSALAGGTICALANAYFTRKAFMYIGARAAARMLKAIYTGEAIKLLLIAAGFAMAFVYVEPLNIFYLFAGFLAVHITGVIAAVSLQNHPMSNRQAQ